MHSPRHPTAILVEFDWDGRPTYLFGTSVRHQHLVAQMHRVIAASLRASDPLVREPAQKKQDPPSVIADEGSNRSNPSAGDRRAASAQCDTRTA